MGEGEGRFIVVPDLAESLALDPLHLPPMSRDFDDYSEARDYAIELAGQVRKPVAIYDAKTDHFLAQVAPSGNVRWLFPHSTEEAFEKDLETE